MVVIGLGAGNRVEVGLGLEDALLLDDRHERLGDQLGIVLQRRGDGFAQREAGWRRDWSAPRIR